MEQSLTSYLADTYDLPDLPLNEYSPLTLAYIGDAVLELLIRTVIVRKGNGRPKDLNRKTVRFVSAKAQSAMMEKIEPCLTEEEEAVYRRGRNAHSATVAKNASVQDYRRATGMETLAGYLYLKKEYTRLIELLKIGTGEI